MPICTRSYTHAESQNIVLENDRRELAPYDVGRRARGRTLPFQADIGLRVALHSRLDLVALASFEGVIRCFDLSTYEERWRCDTPASIDKCLSFNDQLLVLGSDSALRTISLADGLIKKSEPNVAYAWGIESWSILVTGSVADRNLQLKLRDGSLRTHMVMNGVLAGADCDNIAVLSETGTGRALAFDSTGSWLWSFEPGASHLTLAIARGNRPDRLAVFLRSTSSAAHPQVAYLERTTGREMYRLECPSNHFCTSTAQSGSLFFSPHGIFLVDDERWESHDLAW